MRRLRYISIFLISLTCGVPALAETLVVLIPEKCCCCVKTKCSCGCESRQKEDQGSQEIPSKKAGCNCRTNKSRAPKEYFAALKAPDKKRIPAALQQNLPEVFSPAGREQISTYSDMNFYPFQSRIFVQKSSFLL